MVEGVHNGRRVEMETVGFEAVVLGRRNVQDRLGFRGADSRLRSMFLLLFLRLPCLDYVCLSL
ncbi:hypothetical protein Sjap_026412 [Stephania japonica]|uniref:Uncharacterized protein n=1 Tax=Stephania japonica TaxID=461633 RepID=A0AAP0E3N1_9MAGN